MTSSQRPEVVECKKLPTCDRKKKGGKKKKKKKAQKKKKKKTLSGLLSMPDFLPSLPRTPKSLPASTP